MAPERRRYSTLFAESLPVSSGDIVFNGQSIVGKRPFEICHAGIARTFQLNAAFETMTVRENVLIASQHGRRQVEVPQLVFDRMQRMSCRQYY